MWHWDATRLCPQPRDGNSSCLHAELRCSSQPCTWIWADVHLSSGQQKQKELVHGTNQPPTMNMDHYLLVFTLSLSSWSRCGRHRSHTSALRRPERELMVTRWAIILFWICSFWKDLIFPFRLCIPKNNGEVEHGCECYIGCNLKIYW